MTNDILTEEGQALRRLLGDLPVVTPDTLAVACVWLLAKIKELDKSNGRGGQVWARPLQIAERFGAKRSQVCIWLARLAEAGKVRRWSPETPLGTRGDTYYNIEDIEKAWILEK